MERHSMPENKTLRYLRLAHFTFGFDCVHNKPSCTKIQSFIHRYFQLYSTHQAIWMRFRFGCVNGIVSATTCKIKANTHFKQSRVSCVSEWVCVWMCVPKNKWKSNSNTFLQVLNVANIFRSNVTIWTIFFSAVKWVFQSDDWFLICFLISFMC